MTSSMWKAWSNIKVKFSCFRRQEMKGNVLILSASPNAPPPHFLRSVRSYEDLIPLLGLYSGTKITKILLSQNSVPFPVSLSFLQCTFDLLHTLLPHDLDFSLTHTQRRFRIRLGD